MNFMYKSLCKILGQHSRIIIYGIGHFAQEIYPHLLAQGLKEKIFCFAQTKESEISSVDGIPVIQVDKLLCQKDDCIVLVAVSKLYEEEIRQNLIKHSYTNIILLTDYCVNHKNTEDMFFGFTKFEEYCDAIAGWYMKTHTDIIDKNVIMERIYELGKYKNREVKQDRNIIVIISGHISARNNRIFSALKKKGYQIVILDYCFAKQEWCKKEFDEISNLIYECECLEEMLYLALQYYPLVYYFEPRWADCSWAQIMLKQKEHFGKIVLTLYDVLNDGQFIQLPRTMSTEKYSLENADGIVWRWFSKEYLEQKGFNHKGSSMVFLDYCSCEHNIPSVKSSSSDVLKLCYVVGVDSFFAKKRGYNPNYKCLARLDEILAKIGNRKDCLFHFYVGRLREEWIEMCREYEQQYSNFKLYLNVERHELLQRLKEYDYGCNIATKGEWPPDEMFIDNSTGSALKNCVRNTFFDYLSAGLPIIASLPLRLIEYLKKYDVIVDMDISNFDVELLKQRKEYYKKNVESAVKDLDIDKQIIKLIDFLKTV